MTSQPIFIDSNIWLYRLLADQDPDPHEDARKRSIAIALTDSEGIFISTQVINEVCINVIRQTSLNEADILNLIEDFESHCTVMELSTLTLKNASYLRTQHHFSFWDSLIVASAIQAGASILYSEDMQDGLTISKQLKVINPFK